MDHVHSRDPAGLPADDLRGALQAAIGALEAVEEAVVVADAEGLAVLAVNRAGRDLLAGREAVGRPLEWLFPDEDPGEVRRRVRALVRSGGRSMGLAARPVWDDRQGRRVAVRLDVVRRGDVPLVVAFMRSSPGDGSAHRARGDVLAGLPGREALLRALDAEVRRAFRHGRDLAVVAVRLALPGVAPGSEAEVAVLAGVSERLRGATRAEETVGRVDRTGLAWLLPETGAEGARLAADRARTVIGEAYVESGVGVSVGTAALVRGDTAHDLLRRAEQDAHADPGPGRRAYRVSAALHDEADALMRAASHGDARAVEEMTVAALTRYGHARAYDEVLQPVMSLLGRSAGDAGPERSAGQHRAAALLEWAVGRRPPVHPPPDGPVAVVVPAGVDVRRLTLPAACDAVAAAGWMPLAMAVPPAAELARPVSQLSARCLVLAVGNDSDLVEAGHLLRGLAEALPDLMLVVAAAPDGILRRWRPPAPAVGVSSSVLLVEMLDVVRRPAADSMTV